LEACSDTYTELGANATDNCSVGAVTVGGDTVDANTPGIYTVTYNVTDTNGVAADEVTRIVTVSDTTEPVINLNGAATITLEACSDTYTELGANATDNCSVGTVTVGGDTVDANTPGIYNVTYNVTDTNGVAADEVTRIVTVSDTTKPVINLNGAATITLEACSDTYTELGANATDNCSVGAVTVGGDSVDANTPGIYTVTYNVTDTNGVAADEVTRIVTVSDTTKPVINLNGAATITLEACSDTYTELGANATDNCSVGAVT
ncbi:immunoglobulin-like domain-containing protein, partial [Winogradskyella bathintestinalis]